MSWNESSSEFFFQKFLNVLQLEILILDNNKLTLTGVDAEVKDEFAILHSLHTISMKNNPVRSVEKNLFYPVSTSLVDLNMNNCSLQNINACKYIFSISLTQEIKKIILINA